MTALYDSLLLSDDTGDSLVDLRLQDRDDLGDKSSFIKSTRGSGATCSSCGHCRNCFFNDLGIEIILKIILNFVILINEYAKFLI